MMDWTEYDEKTEARCEYCGCSREDIIIRGMECCCGMGLRVEHSGDVELEGFNNIDMVLEGKR